jgi:predicted transcriptional regulator
MSESKDVQFYDSLTRREFGLDILRMVSNVNIPPNFKLIMEKLNISKRALSLTLKDLEKDKLIIQTRIGRKSIVSITDLGISTLENYLPTKSDKQTYVIKEIINATISQMELEGLTKDWTAKKRKDFIKKLADTLINQQK